MIRLRLRKAYSGDLELLYKWANDPEVREKSFNTEPISLEDHTIWFNKCIESPATIIYIMTMGDEQIGQIRFQIQEQWAKISYSIAREYRGKGFGERIIDLAEKQLKKDFRTVLGFVAFVKSNNYASKAIFEKSGYISMNNSEMCEYRKVFN